MCETTDGTACPCSETPSPTTKRRTCATPGCERIASGGAKHCRTCRAEAPLRAEMARRYDARRREVQAYREALGGVVRNLQAADITGTTAGHAARLAAVALTKARAERDNATKALAVARDHARGLEVRLRRAKDDRDDAVATVQQLTEAVGELRIERDDWRSVAKKNANERGQAHMELASLKSLYGGLGQHHKALRTRLHIMYAVAVLLGVAAGALALGGGVL